MCAVFWGAPENKSPKIYPSTSFSPQHTRFIISVLKTKMSLCKPPPLPSLPSLGTKSLVCMKAVEWRGKGKKSTKTWRACTTRIFWRQICDQSDGALAKPWTNHIKWLVSKYEGRESLFLFQSVLMILWKDHEKERGGVKGWGICGKCAPKTSRQHGRRGGREFHAGRETER